MPQATAAEALAGLVSNKAVMPSGLSWPRAFVGTGYQRLPGTPGLLIQWGVTGNLGDLGAGFYYTQPTFSIAFTGLFIVIPFVVTNNDGAHHVDCQWDQGSSSLTYATIRYAESVATTQIDVRIGYLAIGY